LLRSARALSLLRNRDFVTPQDVYDIAYDVLNHRLSLTYDAQADGITVDDVLVTILATVPALA
jgi:MoxR-like ATPase